MTPANVCGIEALGIHSKSNVITRLSETLSSTEWNFLAVIPKDRPSPLDRTSHCVYSSQNHRYGLLPVCLSVRKNRKDLNVILVAPLEL